MLTLSRLRPTRPLPLLIAAVLVLSAGCAAKNPHVTAADVSTYVALGDSYTAGVGLAPVSDSVCSRSGSNYPSLLAKALKIKSFTDASCAGASSSNLHEFQKTQKGSNNPQLEAVSKDTTLVTIGLGLNDGGLSVALLYPCLGVSKPLSDTCKAYLKAPESTFDAAFRSLGASVKADLDDIREQAPKARIVLIGYPRMLPDDRTCPAQLPVPDAAAVRIRWSLKKVNDTLERSARRARVDYVDMFTASAGHDVCSKDPWVNGKNVIPGKALPYHPYAAYHRAVAAKLEGLLSAS